MRLDRVAAMLLAPNATGCDQDAARHAIDAWLAAPEHARTLELAHQALAHPGGEFLPFELDDDERRVATCVLASARQPGQVVGCVIQTRWALDTLGELAIGSRGRLEFFDQGFPVQSAPRLRPREARRSARPPMARARASLMPTDLGCELRIEFERGRQDWAAQRPSRRAAGAARPVDDPSRSETASLFAVTWDAHDDRILVASCTGAERLLRLSAMAQARTWICVTLEGIGSVVALRLAPLEQHAVELQAVPMAPAALDFPGIALDPLLLVAVDREAALRWIARHGLPEESLDTWLLEALADLPAFRIPAAEPNSVPAASSGISPDLASPAP